MRVKHCECPGGALEHAPKCWARPANITINQRRIGFARWVAQLKAEADAEADATRICECGARNARDAHSASCWARPAGPWPFQQKGWKGGEKWWRSVHGVEYGASESRWFADEDGKPTYHRFTVKWGGFMRAELRQIDKAIVKNLERVVEAED